MSRQITIACRVLPDRAGRPRVAYLTGWQIGRGPTWTWNPDTPAVLRGSEQDAARWLAELRREGIVAHAAIENP